MKKRIVSTMLAAVLLSGTATALISLFSACSESVGMQKKIEIADADFHVWTMPSVERVLRDLDYSQYYTDAPVLQYEAARNEYESAQILFNTESDIRWYDLKVRDMVSANGERIYAADMDVYNQYYTQLQVLTKRDSGRPLGYYPDALVPMKYAKLAGENSFEVEDGKSRNQGLWVRVKTRKDTPAGLYKGKFTLTVNNESVDIPVSFEVYDFTLTDANHLKSSFHLAQEYIAGGQRDNRNETYSAIVEQLLDYRISTDVPT